jgi:hypothetical protein
MRININSLLKSYGTWTNPAAETKSIGLPADPAFGEGRRTGALFFARHLDYFIVTQNFTAVYRDLVSFRHIMVTPNFRPSTGTGKKRGTPTPFANALGRLPPIH